jgi:formylglycine-generating enzyme required for sulfatase activity
MRSPLSHLTNSAIRATTGLEANGGRGSNGGVWEWTSTPLDSHDGLSPTEHFPGYSTDFFDGKHHVVVSLGRRYILLSVDAIYAAWSFVRYDPASCRTADNQELLSTQLSIPMGRCTGSI